MAVTGRLDGLATLDQADIHAMCRMLDRHFDGVCADTFQADLQGKTHVVRLFTPEQRLCGFSTLDYRVQMLHGRPAGVVYSGDTIVDPVVWDSAQLGSVWVASVLELHGQAAQPGTPLWWLLLTSGVRTYRYLTACIERYAPAPVARLDGEAEALLGILARARFENRFDPDSGVVRLAHPQRLRGALAEVPPHLARDPLIQVFLARNPGHQAGDELVSLCRLQEGNLTRTGRLALRRGRLLAQAQAGSP